MLHVKKCLPEFIKFRFRDSVPGIFPTFFPSTEFLHKPDTERIRSIGWKLDFHLTLQWAILTGSEVPESLLFVCFPLITRETFLDKPLKNPLGIDAVSQIKDHKAPPQFNTLSLNCPLEHFHISLFILRWHRQTPLLLGVSCRSNNFLLNPLQFQMKYEGHLWTPFFLHWTSLILAFFNFPSYRVLFALRSL